MSLNSPGYCASPRSPRSPRSPAAPPPTQFTFGAKSPRSPRSPRSPKTGCHFTFPAPASPGGGGGGGGGGGRESRGGARSPSARSPSSREPWARCRRSTSDLTDLQENGHAGPPPRSPTAGAPRSRPCSPRPRAGSIKAPPAGGLAYLASRRGSRDSTRDLASRDASREPSNEDIGPLNFSATARGRQRRTSNFLELPVPDHIRPRVCSLPEQAFNPRRGDELYRLRTFSITTKGGVVNCGDALVDRRSRSNTSVNSTANSSRHSGLSGVSPGERSPFEGSCCGSSYHNVSSAEDSSAAGGAPDEPPKYRVLMLGDSGVGKTALVSQFMTSEYMNTYDASLDDEFGEKSVSVLLDGEEAEMIFIDHPSAEMSVENALSTYEPHACVVVYSVTDRASHKAAEETLNYLWCQNFTQERSVIVVGNKADLARARAISSNEGKTLAASRDCKFIETSSGLQHHVDELLVGVLKQIRLREQRAQKQQRQQQLQGGGGGGGGGGAKSPRGHAPLAGSRTSLSLHIARELLQKMCLQDSKSKSCENLHVL